jgi:hypothetical protein
MPTQPKLPPGYAVHRLDISRWFVSFNGDVEVLTKQDRRGDCIQTFKTKAEAIQAVIDMEAWVARCLAGGYDAQNQDRLCPL